MASKRRAEPIDSPSTNKLLIVGTSSGPISTPVTSSNSSSTVQGFNLPNSSLNIVPSNNAPSTPKTASSNTGTVAVTPVSSSSSLSGTPVAPVTPSSSLNGAPQQSPSSSSMVTPPTTKLTLFGNASKALKTNKPSETEEVKTIRKLFDTLKLNPTALYNGIHVMKNINRMSDATVGGLDGVPRDNVMLLKGMSNTLK